MEAGSWQAAPVRKREAACFCFGTTESQIPVLTYFLTSSAESWSAAETEAISVGGHLASVHDSTLNNLLANTFEVGAPLWIGLSDPTQTNNFVWSDGSTVDFTDWQSGEPNDASGIEHYTTIGWHYAQGSTSDKATWNDAPLAGTIGYGGHSDGSYYGIIEVADAPEPSSIGLSAIGLAAFGFVALRSRRAASRP